MHDSTRQIGNVATALQGRPHVLKYSEMLPRNVQVKFSRNRLLIVTARG
jgi:hypothetical protein